MFKSQLNIHEIFNRLSNVSLKLTFCLVFSDKSSITDELTIQTIFTILLCDVRCTILKKTIVTKNTLRDYLACCPTLNEPRPWTQWILHWESKSVAAHSLNWKTAIRIELSFKGKKRRKVNNETVSFYFVVVIMFALDNIMAPLDENYGYRNWTDQRLKERFLQRDVHSKVNEIL